MPKKYDEFTDSWLEDEEKPEVNTETISGQQQKTHAADSDKENPDELIKQVPIKRLNKKVIMIVMMSLAVLLCLYRLLPKKKAVAKQEKQQASEISIPDFGDYKNRGYQENTQTYIEPIGEPYQPMIQTSSNVQTRKEPERVTKPVQAVQVSNSQDTLPSRSAGLSANIEWLNKSPVNSGSSRNEKPDSYNPLLSPDEYLNSRLAGLSSLSGSSQALNESTYAQQNMQGNKNDFYTNNADGFLSGSFIGKDSIWVGTIIPAVLLTGISTDNPGIIKAQVTENIYDSLTGKTLLIPQGTVLIAEYNSYISYAQKRVQIAWNNLIRPDGFQLNLTNMPGTDSQGISGIKGRVDEHLWEYLKAMGIVTVFSAINAGVSDSINTINQLQGTENDYAQNLMAQNQNVINQLGSKLIDRAMDVQPTIRIANGTKVNIFVNKNIVLPPLPDNPVKEAYKRN